jgi:hypothetical protein
MQNTGSNWQLIEETSRLLAQLNTALDVIVKRNSHWAIRTGGER